MTTQILEPGFMLIHGNRAEELCDIAVHWLQENPLAVLEPETILVQSAGVAQWLQQKIAMTGVAAAINFVLPASFVWQAYKSVLTDEKLPEQSLLSKDKLIWQLYRLLDQCDIDSPAIKNFLSDKDIRKKFQLAKHLASLFDQYQVYRADWLHEWQDGNDIVFAAQDLIVELNDEQKWQAQLWRLILADTQATHGELWGRAQIHNEFINNLATNSTSYKLPRRIIVFGISSMPKQILEALVALSSQVQVLVFINNPCEHYWGDIQGQQEILRSSLKRHQKRPNTPLVFDDDDLHNNAQPLLASWGKQGRDFIAMLDNFDTPDRRNQGSKLFARIEQKTDIFNPLAGANLLEQIQDDIRDLRPVSESKNWPAINPELDQSVCFHIAYSKQRELEVLHDQLIEAFHKDKQLKPSDVIIMVPDISDYAPHIEAVFGQYDKSDNRYLPFAIADRGKRNIDPLVVAIEKLLSLPDLRFGANEVLNLLDVPAIRNKFNLQEQDLPIIRYWVEQSNIRWGLDGRQKSDYIDNLTNYSAQLLGNTWDFGLFRMLLGYASGQTDADWQGIFPYAETGGMQSVALGSLANYVEQLHKYSILLHQDRTPEDWVATIGVLLDSMLLADNTQDESTILRFKQVLQDCLDNCIDANFTDKLPLKIVSEYCLDLFDQSVQSPRFFAGAITFATLLPMRAIPFKYICLLGMQDGDFPRMYTPDDFDLMYVFPRAGDRSKREDDRYLFLEALLSAREKFYVSWVGLDVNDSTEQPPSVLVEQLIDHIRDTRVNINQDVNLIDDLTIKHPLQPFSKKYFYQDGSNYFTYANEWHSSYQDSPSLDNSLINKLTQSDERIVNSTFRISDLKSFMRQPVRFYYKSILGISFNDFLLSLDEDETYELNKLEQWQIKDAMLNLIVQSDNNDDVLIDYANNLILKGDISNQNTADIILNNINNLILPIRQTYTYVHDNYPDLSQAINIDLALSNNINIQDTVNHIRFDGHNNYCNLILLASDLVGPLGKTNYRYKHLAGIWFEHLVLNACFHPLRTYVASPKGIVYLERLDNAREILDKIAAGFVHGLDYPLACDPELARIWLSNADKKTAYALVSKQYDKELSNKLYMAHAFKSFDDFIENGEFIKWAEILYSDLRPYINNFNIDKND